MRKLVSAGIAEMKKDAALIAQTSGIVQEASKNWDFVFRSSNGGMKGSTPEDFQTDGEVKKMPAGIHQYMGQIERN